MKRRFGPIGALPTILLLSFALRTSADPPRYTITDLGVLPGDESSFAFGISPTGAVTGYSSHEICDDVCIEYKHGFLYEGGTMTALGDYNGQDAIGSAVNSAGQIAAYTYTGVWRALLWEDGQHQDLGALGGAGAQAYDVSESEVVVGKYYAPSPISDWRAFVWENGVMTGLDAYSGTDSAAYAVNSAGDIVGESGARAVLWRNGQIIDLGWGPGSEARDINDDGVIIGRASYTPPGTTFATLWRNGEQINLGTLPGTTASDARALNSWQEIVGDATGSSSHNAAFLWKNGQMYNLNELVEPGHGWRLYSARAINDDGWIVGTGINPQPQWRAYLLKPLQPPVPALAFWGQVVLILLLLIAAVLVVRIRGARGSQVNGLLFGGKS